VRPPFAQVRMPCGPGVDRAAGWTSEATGSGGDGGAGEAADLLEGPTGEVSWDTGANPRGEGCSMRGADAVAQGSQDGKGTIESCKKSSSVSQVLEKFVRRGKQTHRM
jgi:hypothetical protein